MALGEKQDMGVAISHEGESTLFTEVLVGAIQT
jgi:hypothetical protein